MNRKEVKDMKKRTIKIANFALLTLALVFSLLILLPNRGGATPQKGNSNSDNFNKPVSNANAPTNNNSNSSRPSNKNRP